MTDPSIYDEDYFKSMRGLTEFRPLYDHFVETFTNNDDSGSQVLDAGCGRGELLEALYLKRSCITYGLDFSEAAVVESRRRLATATGREVDAQVVHGSITRADTFAPASFDLVFMLDIVEHLPPAQLIAGLKNVRLWLKPGGRLCIHTFPTLIPHRAFRSLLWISRKTRELAELDAIHCNVQTKARLTSALRESGFEVSDIWLRNDLVHSSSTYQNMREGASKRVISYLATDFVAAGPVRALARFCRLDEVLEPSIYVTCVPSTIGPGSGPLDSVDGEHETHLRQRLKKTA